MNSARVAQIKAIIRLELKKTFFARRGLWIYLLAFAPVAMFLAQVLVQRNMQGESRNADASVRRVSTEDMGAIDDGMTLNEVLARLGPPHRNRSFDRLRRTGPDDAERVQIQILQYPTEAGEYVLTFENHKLVGTQTRGGITLERESYVFAGVFQFFFIRLAVFFGCLGIFMNLVRGEMLDKTLHYYLLSPVRRSVLITGKYLAGLLAAVVIFTTSGLLQFFAISLIFDSNTVHRFLYQEHGLAQAGAYLAVTILGCIGYGSVFLGAGLLFRNPIFAAAVVLVWEAASPLFPAAVQKFSVIYYLKSMCPVQVPLDPGAPKLFALLVSNTEPISPYLAVAGIVALSSLVLYWSAKRMRGLQINYTTE